MCGMANPNSTNVPDLWHKMHVMVKVVVKVGYLRAKKNAD